MNNKFDFNLMYDDLSYIGNNDPYVSDLYFRVLNQLNELSELQEQNRIIILNAPLTVEDLEVIKDIGKIVNNLEDMKNIGSK